MTPNPRLSALLLAVTLALLHIATTARADPPGNQNAAHVLRPLFVQYRDLWETAGYPDVVALYDPARYAPPTQGQLDASKAFIRGLARPLVERLIAATRIEHCDWEIDASKGPNAQLFHLGEARYVALLLCADAQIRFEDDDPASAAESYAAILRLARHARGTDLFLKSSIVEASISVMACKGIRSALDRGLFEPAHRQGLLRELERIDPNDPHNLRQAVAADGRMFIDWLRRAYQPGKTETPEMREYIDSNPVHTQTRKNAEQLLALMKRGEPLEPMLERFQSFYDAVLAAWDGPNPTHALRVLSEQALAGKYGAITALIFPRSSASARDTHDMAVATFALLRERLEN